LGAGWGLVSSIPIGPINLTIIGTALKANVQRSVAIACAVAVVDGIYAFIAASAISMPNWSMRVWQNSGLCGAILITGYGFYLIFGDRPTRSETEPVRIPVLHRDLGLGALTGVALYVSNPTFMLFWLGAVGTSRLWSPNILAGNQYLFGAGAILGTSTWFLFLLYKVRRSSVLASAISRKRLSITGGWLLVAFGAYALIASLKRML
jgi:threonine/homoserine/homoserine lactone efflux protein